MGFSYRASSQDRGLAPSGWAVFLGGALAALLSFACNKTEPSGTSSGASGGATAVASSAPRSTASAERKSVPPPSDVATPPEAAEKLENGILSVVLEKGTGSATPKDIDRVKVHYSGWTRDGRMLVSTQVRNRPHTLPMDRLKGGWEGQVLSKMVVGEKRRFWVPAEAARSGFSRRAKKEEPITFDLSLVEIIEVPQPPPVPDDVAKAPKDAKVTKSGIAYKVLQKGSGTVHPAAEQRVEVHYTGWTPDGKMFDSSVPRGQPSTFALNQVIKGWTEGVQLMVEGEKTRFWIPSDLAYGDKPSRPGAPAGPLVFDIELLKVH